MKTNYTLHLPDGYQPPPLPGRDEWCEDLRINTDKQTTGRLGMPEGPNCCLGRLCLLQGRLDSTGKDLGAGAGAGLSFDNPLISELSSLGDFPRKVSVKLEDALGKSTCLTELNDIGMSFDDIADIIEAVWADGGPLEKVSGAGCQVSGKEGQP